MKPSLKRLSFKAMGSYCEIQVYSESRIDAKRIVRQLAAEINRLEQKYSRFLHSSFLSQINSSAGDRMGIKIDNETKSLFEHALTCYEQSEGKGFWHGISLRDAKKMLGDAADYWWQV